MGTFPTDQMKTKDRDLNADELIQALVTISVVDIRGFG